MKVIAELLIDIPANKAIGTDNISAKMLKLAGAAIAQPLCRLVNCSIDLKSFPCVWKTARVRPLHKGDDASEMDNYRPISVLPVLAKVIEKHVHASLYNYLCTNNLLYKYQSGFRRNHSTETAIIKLVDQLLFNADKNMVTSAVFIDYRKAFDTVSHNVLLRKLEAYDLSADAVSWFASYLQERQQYVCIGGYSSPMLPLVAGVPQGSVLGPLLFLVFINDLPLESKEVTTDIYADDTTITAAADWSKSSELVSTMNFAMESITNWTSENRLSINQSKTKSVLFASKRIRSKMPPNNQDLNITLPGSDTPITQVKSQKLLGVTLDQDLTFDDHVESLGKKLSKRIGLLKRIKNCLPYEERVSFYTATIKPALMYGSSVWTLCSKSNIDLIFKLQKRAARVILNVDNCARTVPLFNRLKWLPFYEEAKINRHCILFKRVYGNLPEYMDDILIRNSDIHKRSTRYNEINFICPKYKLETEAGRSFTVTSIKEWNSLPIDVRKLSTVKSFKSFLIKKALENQSQLDHF